MAEEKKVEKVKIKNAFKGYNEAQIQEHCAITGEKIEDKKASLKASADKRAAIRKAYELTKKAKKK